MTKVCTQDRFKQKIKIKKNKNPKKSRENFCLKFRALILQKKDLQNIAKRKFV